MWLLDKTTPNSFAAIGPLSKLMDERMVLILAAMVPMLVGSLVPISIHVFIYSQSLFVLSP